MTISDLHLECRAEETKLHNRIAELETELAEVKAENAKLKEALREYIDTSDEAAASPDGYLNGYFVV